MAHLYYVEPSADGLSVGRTVELDPGESRHAAKVSRMRVGERVRVGDGRGLIAAGQIVETTPSVAVRIDEVDQRSAPPVRVGLAQALATGGRDELAVQTATELGIDVVYPWQADRSVSVWRGEKRSKSVARWRTIVREAGKQSLRAHLPEVGDPLDSARLARLSGDWRLVVLDPGAQHRLAALDDDGRDILLVVGPEGGVSERELALFAAAGASSARLGETVVRTSSAGAAGLVVLNVTLARLGW